MTAQVHTEVIKDDGAQSGERTSCWYWIHVCGGTRIGKQSSLRQDVLVGNDLLICKKVIIQNNRSVYDAMMLEEDVLCGSSIKCANVCNRKSAVNGNDEYSRTLVVRDETMGANCTTVCGTTIGTYRLICAAVNRDVKAYALMVGVPARQIGWMPGYAEWLAIAACRWRRQPHLCAHRESLPSGRQQPIVLGESDMRVEAIYDDGRLELPAGVHLKRPRIRLTVVIPDDQIAAAETGETGAMPTDPASEGGQCGDTSTQQPSIREAIDGVLGPWKGQIENGPPLVPEDCDRLRYEALEEKHLGARKLPRAPAHSWRSVRR